MMLAQGEGLCICSSAAIWVLSTLTFVPAGMSLYRTYANVNCHLLRVINYTNGLKMFASKVRAFQVGHLKGAPIKGRLIAFPIRLSWKGLLGTNTPAY